MARFTRFAFLALLALAALHSPLQRAAACELLRPPTGAVAQPALDAGDIRILSWNLQKSGTDGWTDDFRRLTARTDLALIQEARLGAGLEALFGSQSHRYFAPGFTAFGMRTGVMTLSRTPADAGCHFSEREPWLGTPKATAVSRYRLRGSSQSLLVVNLHAVNFSLGISAFERQLGRAAELIASHDGPVILGGDFNTWSTRRTARLRDHVRSLELSSIALAEDVRSRVFGRVLDHVFVRGLTTVESRVVAVDSSDHNPITATLRVID